MTLAAASFAQAAPGTLSVGIIAGSSALQNPVVQLTGAANLGGGLGVTTSGSQTSPVNLVQAASVSGTFPAPQFAGESYAVGYTSTAVTLSPGASATTTPPTTTNPTAPKPTSGAKAGVSELSGHPGGLSVKLSCPRGTAACSATTIRATVTEHLKAAKGKKTKTKVVTVASATARLAAGKSRTVKLKLNRAGLALLKGHKQLQVSVTITASHTVLKRAKIEVRAPQTDKTHKQK
jgi:hypothetical protein